MWKHLAGDFAAREIIAVMSGLSVNTPTNTHSAKIIFGDDKNQRDKFIYTDLATGRQYSGKNHPEWQNGDPLAYGYFNTDPVSFPGYTYSFGESEYKGVDPSEGGRVQAKLGILFWFSLFYFFFDNFWFSLCCCTFNACLRSCFCCAFVFLDCFICGWFIGFYCLNLSLCWGL